jgi:hypothetical protein
MKAIIDPKEARRFAHFLDERAKDLQNLDSRTSRALLDLHAAHWRDERFRQFEKRYEEASLLLRQFAEHAQRYAEYLRKKAAPIERYLDRRY